MIVPCVAPCFHQCFLSNIYRFFWRRGNSAISDAQPGNALFANSKLVTQDSTQARSLDSTLHSALDSTLTKRNGKHDPEDLNNIPAEHAGPHREIGQWQKWCQKPWQARWTALSTEPWHCPMAKMIRNTLDSTPGLNNETTEWHTWSRAAEGPV